jgi:hypothetical protein
MDRSEWHKGPLCQRCVAKVRAGGGEADTAGPPVGAIIPWLGWREVRWAEGRGFGPIQCLTPFLFFFFLLYFISYFNPSNLKFESL